MPDFAGIENVVRIGVAAVETTSLEHRNGTGIGKRVGYYDIGQGGFAIVANIDRVIGHIARAIDHRGRTGGVAAVGAVGNIDEGLVDQNVRDGVMVADRINLNRRANSRIGGHDDRLIGTGGLGRASWIHFIDEIGAVGLDAVKGVISICVSDRGLQLDIARIKHTVMVSVFEQLDSHPANKRIAAVLDPVAVDITELGTVQHNGVLSTPFFEGCIGVVIGAGKAKSGIEIEVGRRGIFAAKCRHRNKH